MPGIDPDAPHRYQAWPIPTRKQAKSDPEKNVGPGSIGYWRHYNGTEVRGDVRVDAPTPCQSCGCSPGHPVHFVAGWQNPARNA